MGVIVSRWAVGVLFGVCLCLLPRPTAADPPPVDERDAEVDSVFADVGLTVGDGGRPALRAEAGIGLGLVAPLHPAVDLDLHLPIGFTYGSLDQDLGAFRIYGNQFAVDAATMFDFQFAIIPAVQLFVAPGAGLGWSYVEIEQPSLGFQVDWAFAALLRLQAGGRFQPIPGLWIDVVPLSVTLSISENVGGSVSFLAGIRWNEVAP